MIGVMRAPDDPYPDTLRRIIGARIAGDEVTALKALSGDSLRTKATQTGTVAIKDGHC